MSSPLAIAAVSAVLKDLLDNAMIDRGVTGVVNSPVLVSALAPDLINVEKDHPARLNLFMYHVTPNQGWRNERLPSRNGHGNRISNPPLALDLHYMLTAYASKDFHAEILLGYAMQLLHEFPVLTRAAINRSLDPPAGGDGEDIRNLPGPRSQLAGADLTDQVEQIKITPEIMSIEEMSKLWAAIQGHYRPTAAYKASVVLIESEAPARTPLPVLMRGVDDRGVVVNVGVESPYPVLTGIRTPSGGDAANVGDEITLVGHRLANPVAVRFRNRMYDITRDREHFVSATPEEIVLSLPDDPGFRVGIYGVSVVLEQPEGRRSTNELPLMIAPTIDPIEVNKTTRLVTVRTAPKVELRQRALLIIGDHEIAPESYMPPTDTLTFDASGIVAGEYRVRLRIDDIESLLIDRTTVPPQFIHTVVLP